MRYLCAIGFAYAAAIGLAALLPDALLPMAGFLLVLGFVFGLIYRANRRRQLFLLAIALFGAVLGLTTARVHQVFTLEPVSRYDGLTATVTVELREAPVTTRYQRQVCRGTVELDGRSWSAWCSFNADEQLRVGDRVTASFHLYATGTDGKADYNRSAGNWLRLYQAGDAQITRPDRLRLRDWPAWLADRLRSVCAQLWDETIAPWFQALLFNENHNLPYSDENALKLAGAYHILCVSGMHISILIGMIGRLCGRRKRRAAFISVPVCLFYLAMVGATPAATRAVLMQFILLAAPLLRRESDPPTSLAVALIVILAINPDSITNLGFQLSFLSVAGILLFSERADTWLRNQTVLGKLAEKGNPAARSLTASISTSLGALSLTTPLLAWTNGAVALLAPLTAVLMLGVVSVCYTLGLLTTLLGLFSVAAARIPAYPLSWLMHYCRAVALGIARLPFAAVYLQSKQMLLWLTLSYFVLLVLLWYKKRIRLPVCSLLLAAVLSAIVGVLHGGTMHSRYTMTVLDVGQGQCLILEQADRVIVIDCGGSEPEKAGEACARYLLAHNRYRINLFVLTHYHQDHAGGAAQLLSRVPADMLVLPDVPDDTGTKTLHAAADAEVYWATEDLSVQLEGGTMTVFAPVAFETDNEACLSVLISVAEDDILITGDMSAGTELLLCKHTALPDLEYLVAGHHGSREASGAYLLEQTRPDTVLISVAADNRYGHPHTEALARFAAIGAEVRRTDLEGTITIGK